MCKDLELGFYCDSANVYEESAGERGNGNRYVLTLLVLGASESLICQVALTLLLLHTLAHASFSPLNVFVLFSLLPRFTPFFLLPLFSLFSLLSPFAPFSLFCLLPNVFSVLPLSPLFS